MSDPWGHSQGTQPGDTGQGWGRWLRFVWHIPALLPGLTVPPCPDCCVRTVVASAPRCPLSPLETPLSQEVAPGDGGEEHPCPHHPPDGWEQMEGAGWKQEGEESSLRKAFLAEMTAVFLKIPMSWGQKPCEVELPLVFSMVSLPFLLETGITNGSSFAWGPCFAESPAGRAPGFPFPTVSPTACTPKIHPGAAGKSRRKEKSQPSPKHRKSPWGKWF